MIFMVVDFPALLGPEKTYNLAFVDFERNVVNGLLAPYSLRRFFTSIDMLQNYWLAGHKQGGNQGLVAELPAKPQQSFESVVP